MRERRLPAANRLVLAVSGLGAIVGSLYLIVMLVLLTAYAMVGGDSLSGPAESGDTGLVILIVLLAATAAIPVIALCSLGTRLLSLGGLQRRLPWRHASIIGTLVVILVPLPLLAVP